MQPTSFWWYIWQTQVSLQQLLISTTTTIIAKRMLGLSHLYKVHLGSRDFFLQHFNIVLLGDELPAMFLAVSLRLQLQHATNVWKDKMKPTVNCNATPHHTDHLPSCENGSCSSTCSAAITSNILQYSSTLAVIVTPERVETK